jgi:hypothetical protein
MFRLLTEALNFKPTAHAVADSKPIFLVFISHKVQDLEICTGSSKKMDGI